MHTQQEALQVELLCARLGISIHYHLRQLWHIVTLHEQLTLCEVQPHKWIRSNRCRGLAKASLNYNHACMAFLGKQMPADSLVLACNSRNAHPDACLLCKDRTPKLSPESHSGALRNRGNRAMNRSRNSRASCPVVSSAADMRVSARSLLKAHFCILCAAAL